MPEELMDNPVEEQDLEQEVVEDDDVVVDEDDNTEGEQEESQPDEPTESPDDADREEWASEEDYLKHHGLNDYSNIDEAMEDFKRMRLQARQQAQQKPSSPPEEEKPKGAEEAYFPRGVMAAHIKKLVDSGQFANEEAAKTYKSLASVTDAAMDPVFNKIEQTFNALAGGLQNLIKAQRNESWSKTPKYIKDKFTRERLEQYMDRYGLLDYRKAFHAASIEGGEDVLSEMFTSVQKQQTPQKKLKKFSAAPRPRTAPSSDPGGKWKQYFYKDGTPNEDAVKKLPAEKQEAFWDYVIKKAKKDLGE